MSDTLPVLRFPPDAIVTADGEPVALTDATLEDLVDWRERVLREAADIIKARLASVDAELEDRCRRSGTWTLHADGWRVEAKKYQPKLYESAAKTLRLRLLQFADDDVIDEAAVDKCIPLKEVPVAKIGALRQLADMVGFDVADTITDAIPAETRRVSIINDRRVVVTPARRATTEDAE